MLFSLSGSASLSGHCKARIHKWDFLKLKSSAQQKKRLTKGNLRNGRKYFGTIYLPDKGLIFEMCEELIQLNIKKLI